MKNKIIVITGITGGVGVEAAKFFTNQNWTVIGIGRNISKLKKLDKLINSDLFHYVTADISSYNSVKSAFTKIKKSFGSISVLINNAAIFKMKEFKKFSSKEIDEIIDTNLKGTIFCTLECLKIMKSGRIINIGSVSGTHGIANQTIYSASKYGINGFAESLNQEIISNNIKVSTIFPGGINTPLWNDKNIYPGDVNKLLTPNDIVQAINYIINLPKNVVLKNMIMFPDNEWH